MAISTIKAHVLSAILFVESQPDLYTAIGRTTPWETETQPPLEDGGKDVLDEVLGYKRISRISLCRPLVDGESTSYQTIMYKSQPWVLVPIEDAYDQNARWVYTDADIYDTEFELEDYRQVGLHVDIVKSAEVTSDAVTPSQVTDVGQLLIYRNKEKQVRQEGITAKEQFIVMF